jgi:hypothetical protein
MKVWTGGEKLWTRTIGSTVVGQAVDSIVFYPLAFLGASGWTPALVMKVLVTNWALKVSWEVILTPLTYAVVGFLKKAEGVDVFDTKTNFSPSQRKSENGRKPAHPVTLHPAHVGRRHGVRGVTPRPSPYRSIRNQGRHQIQQHRRTHAQQGRQHESDAHQHHIDLEIIGQPRADTQNLAIGTTQREAFGGRSAMIKPL